MFSKSQNSNGSVIEAKNDPGFMPPAPGAGQQGSTIPLSTQHFSSIDTNRGGNANVIMLLLLVAAAVIIAVLAYLFFSTQGKYIAAKTDVDGQIESAVAIAVAENRTKMEAEFAEREKSPYREFAGPADYGSLGFKYPQTWSVYVAKDASRGGDFLAYLNPVQVDPITSSSINALQVEIRDTQFDSIIQPYTASVSRGMLSLNTRNIGGILANVYTATPANSFRGAVAIFKLRDKTVILQTDAETFLTEFYKLLDTVTFVQ